MAIYIGMVLVGLGLVAWGLPAAHRLKSPLDIAASFGVLIGVIAALLGALLVFVPHFFEG